jgi:F0F1-type ATP synthase alpha subunit
MFKGEKNSGKTTLTASIIKQFLNTQDKEAKVIYVGLSKKGKELKQTINSDNLMTIGVDDDS